MPRSIVRIVLFLGFAATGALGCPSTAQSQASVVARIAGEEFRCVTPTERHQQGCARTLLSVVRTRAERDFIAHRDLHATDAEIAELVAYNRDFELHDRAQRARKLAELDTRLAANTDPAERERLGRFRAILTRLARYEADVDAGIEERVVVPSETLRRWVETYKLNAMLYRAFGGTVGLNAAGPYPHGAQAALVKQYIETNGVEIVDAEIRRRFRALLQAPPQLVFIGETPDFTPYWKRPIPASYMAD